MGFVSFTARQGEEWKWLSAWDIPAEKRLVFWGDKMYADSSKTAAETVCRLITMGTVPGRMDEMDPDALVINRLPLHKHAVYLPIRNEDGSYGKTPALINARERVSEDYLPLTARNLAMVALASLGDAYGWGASPESRNRIGARKALRMSPAARNMKKRSCGPGKRGCMRRWTETFRQTRT